MSRASLPRLSLLAALFGAGCTGPETRFTVPVDGGFQVEVVGSRLTVAAADGRVLLDGLEGAAGLDAGLAVRDVTTRFEMQFGSFKPTDEAAGPWRGHATWADRGDAVEALDADGDVLARLRFSSPAEGHLAVVLEPGTPEARRVSWAFACDADDHFIGFGAQALDVDHRGQTVPTFVQENGIGKIEDNSYEGIWYVVGRRHSSHLPIPTYLSRRGYMLSAETPYRSVFELCDPTASPDRARIQVEANTTVNVFDGPTPGAALEKSSAHHGRPRRPPRVVFAPWFDAIMGSDEVRRVAAKLRAEQIPAGTMWTEDWRGGAFTNDNYELDEEWTVDRDLYPDFEALADDLHAAGFHFLVYFNPFIYEGSRAWSEVQSRGWLVRREDGTDYTFTGAAFDETGLLDLFDPEARAWAVGKMRDVIALGADGWMNDFAEWLPTDAVTAGGSGADLHNEYPVVWQQVAREAIDGVDDGVERFFFGRSGWFGTPALADVIWAGDQRTGFQPDDGLPTILPIGIGLGVVGVSTYGHDIAGYNASTNAPATKELFFRWLQLGAWSPVMRTHHGLQPELNWTWESDDETVQVVKRYAELHMALVPTWEGLAAQASATGMPIWRGLPLLFPEDAAVWGLTDQVMVGDHILVAPIQIEGALSRDVYLPAGRWYRWTEGDAAEVVRGVGAETVMASAPQDEIPVFVRAGGVVPMFPPGVQTLSRPSPEVPGPVDDRVVHVFLGADGAFAEADGGASYRLRHLADASSSAALSFELEGASLPSCGDAPCVAEGDTIRLPGAGVLSMRQGGSEVATLTVVGAPASVTVVVHRP
ncbi:MAG: TIM-barrel domain-containing protein [Myxococcota bacterium]